MKFGVRFLINIGSEFGSNLGSEFGSKSDPILSPTWGQNFDQIGKRFGTEFGVRSMIRMGSDLGDQLRVLGLRMSGQAQMVLRIKFVHIAALDRLD